MNGKYPGHPQERKVESQKDDQAYLWAPLVLAKETDKIGGKVAYDHEDDVVDDERHDTLRKSGIAPATLVTQTPPLTHRCSRKLGHEAVIQRRNLNRNAGW